MRLLTIPITVLATALSCVALSGPELSDDHEDEGIQLYHPKDIKWQAGPSSLPKGAQIAVLEGDPGKEGPFVFRVKLPDGYRIPPHTHPKPERLTVISGTFNIGMGDKFDLSKGTAMPAGTYGTWMAGMKHYVWTKDDGSTQTVVVSSTDGSITPLG